MCWTYWGLVLAVIWHLGWSRYTEFFFQWGNISFFQHSYKPILNFHSYKMFCARILDSVDQYEFYDSNGMRLIYASWGSCYWSSNDKIHLQYLWYAFHFYEVNAEATVHRCFWTAFFTIWLCQVFHFNLQNNFLSSLSTALLSIHLSKWLKLSI